MKRKSLKDIGYCVEVKPLKYKTEWELVIGEYEPKVLSVHPDLWGDPNRPPIKKDKFIFFKRIFWRVRNRLGLAPKIRGKCL